MFMEKDDSDEFRIPPSKQDSNGAFLIDRSSAYFEPILNYLRHGQLILDTNISAAGQFIFQIMTLIIFYYSNFGLSKKN